MKYYIYTLSHPITKEIRYIGRTTNTLGKRLSIHISEAKRNKSNNLRVNWVKSLLNEGLKPVIEELESFSSVNEIHYFETFYIQLFKSWGFSLTNMTDGGEFIVTNMSSNCKKALSKYLNSRNRVVYQYDFNYNLVATFESVKQASKESELDYTSIRSSCVDKHSYKGYFWSYETLVTGDRNCRAYSYKIIQAIHKITGEVISGSLNFVKESTGVSQSTIYKSLGDKVKYNKSNWNFKLNNK